MSSIVVSKDASEETSIVKLFSTIIVIIQERDNSRNNKCIFNLKSFY